jgi:hypothetical protein
VTAEITAEELRAAVATMQRVIDRIEEMRGAGDE